MTKEERIEDLLADYDNMEIELSFYPIVCLDPLDACQRFSIVNTLREIEEELNSIGFYFKED